MFSKKYPDTYLDTYWGFKHYLSQQRAKIYVEAKMSFLKESKIKHCQDCGTYLKWKERTIDHIIPESIWMEKGYYGLWIDKRNFQVMCKPCNMKKSSDLSHLPLKVIEKLDLKTA